MSNLVIVAIPAEDDLVHKISSEKVPHLTLMYLGETSEDKNVTRMAEFVQHALSIHGHGPFYLEVDHRGELGDEKADVLFFESGWDAKWIKSLRGQLLQQSDIRAAYQSEDQFPEWVPHLTLGYPTVPAKPFPEGYTERFYAVHFDRIAVWDGNYEGPEFRLKQKEDQLVEAHGSTYNTLTALHTAERGGDFLEHYGVKGMRWGVRKDDTGSGGTSGPKKEGVKKGVNKLIDYAGDQQFENMALDGRAREKIIEDGRANFLKEDLPGLREKHGKGASLKTRVLHPLSPEATAYRRDAREAYINQLEKSANKMTNFSETRQFTIRERGFDLPAEGGDLPTSRYFWDVSTRKIQHAADSFDGTTTVELIFDDVGYITDLVPQNSAAAHSMTLDLEGSTEMIGAMFLEHYGVKGMRWGVRKREEPNAVAPQATSRVPHGDKRQTKIDVKGGENHPAAPDAIKIAQVKAKYQKSGPAALNNQELRELQERMNLEANVSRLVAPSSKVERGRRFVKSFTTANKEFNDTARTSLETVRLVKQATS